MSGISKCLMFRHFKQNVLCVKNKLGKDSICLTCVIRRIVHMGCNNLGHGQHCPYCDINVHCLIDVLF